RALTGDLTYNALLRNTISITGLTGSDKTNVIPPVARAGLDVRLLPGQDPDAFLAELVRVVGDTAVAITPLGPTWPATDSPTDTELFRSIMAAARQRTPNALGTTPPLTGFPDSHYLRQLGIAHYGVASVLGGRAAPSRRWEGALLGSPAIAVPVRDLDPRLVGYRIALVTDLHHGPAVPERWFASVADRVADLAPDLVALGGDFVSHARSDLNGLDAIIARFRARDGSVAVLGNHDHWVDPDLVSRIVERAGARLLTNRHELIRRGAAALAVAGVDDFSHGAVRPDDALAGGPPHVPRALLSHNPAPT